MPFENVTKFKYLRMTVTNTKVILEEIKKRLSSGYASDPSVLNRFICHQLTENVKIRKQKIIILSVILYGCETLSMTLRLKYRLRTFETRV
jgi:hypothetical protein